MLSTKRNKMGENQFNHALSEPKALIEHFSKANFSNKQCFRYQILHICNAYSHKIFVL